LKKEKKKLKTKGKLSEEKKRVNMGGNRKKKILVTAVRWGERYRQMRKLSNKRQLGRSETKAEGKLPLGLKLRRKRMRGRGRESEVEERRKMWGTSLYQLAELRSEEENGKMLKTEGK